MSRNETCIAELRDINRGALVLEPTETYLKWVRTCFEDDRNMTLDDLRADEGGTVYLIPEMDDEPWDWLKQHYAAMFDEELEGWCTDEARWPKDRTYKAFRKFFDVRFHSMVFDVGGGGIERGGE